MSSPSKRVDLFGGVEYPSWDTLEEPRIISTDEDFFSESAAATVRTLQNSADWRLQYETLTELQRISKYNPSLLLVDLGAEGAPLTLVEQVHEPILACVNSLRSALSKNAMLTVSALIKGLGSHYVRSLAPGAHARLSPSAKMHHLRIGVSSSARLHHLVSLLLQKAASPAEKKFIQTAAEDTLNLFTTVPQTAEAVLQVVARILRDSKNPRVTNVAAGVLIKCWAAAESESATLAVAQALPILVADRSPGSRAVVKKLAEDLKQTGQAKTVLGVIPPSQRPPVARVLSSSGMGGRPTTPPAAGGHPQRRALSSQSRSFAAPTRSSAFNSAPIRQAPPSLPLLTTSLPHSSTTATASPTHLASFPGLRARTPARRPSSSDIPRPTTVTLPTMIAARPPRRILKEDNFSTNAAFLAPLEKASTTTTTSSSNLPSAEDRNYSDRSRSLSTRLKLFSSRRSLSLNGRLSPPNRLAAPPTLPPWLLDDDDVDA
eukprot:Protomagalhaensia_sp_Gyna_25__101@NODE_104_length_5238_cov_68_434891_g81_i0_p1_GENE_NODE_104_length_5238_cov_68_434891_g81_i0NODE_104_length_5238_cov_68_434891_g81_i0_p1_ORF_typecomplete_len489_score62_64CLASP_N/PF12348_8/5_1e16Rsm22/PF09243_10/5e03Rsm22/PF09243_10/0_052PMC2NT/PF08066_12/26PMC2NT/PF08066_12/21E3_UbLigase_R4/PF13764_6/0_1Adaptin_N/PF01602_20/2_6e02Adaptin_N/PF01602_20/37Adaptin_N/PF01602_20/2_6_NODE_104_length_5238_cov_68_434891_g81_i037065172